MNREYCPKCQQWFDITTGGHICVQTITTIGSRILKDNSFEAKFSEMLAFFGDNGNEKEICRWIWNAAQKAQKREAQAEITKLKSKLSELIEVSEQAHRIITNCYLNFKCDHFVNTYMSYFGRDESPAKSNTGIAAKIHNKELLIRLKINIEEMKNFIDYHKIPN